MDEPEEPTQDPYRSEYFTTLYHAASENGQTRVDRIRDRMVARLVERFAPKGASGRSLLEIGCGYGFLLERLQGRYDLFGIDFSEHAIARIGRRLPGAVIERADVQRAIPFPGPFQAVIAVNVLEHLRDPLAAVRNIREVLVPGGVAVVHLPTIDNPVSRLIYSLSYASDPTHVWRPSAAGVQRVFRHVGFSLVWESQMPHVPRRLWNALRVHPAYLGVYRRERTPLHADPLC